MTSWTARRSRKARDGFVSFPNMELADPLLSHALGSSSTHHTARQHSSIYSRRGRQTVVTGTTYSSQKRGFIRERYHIFWWVRYTFFYSFFAPSLACCVLPGCPQLRSVVPLSLH